MDPLSIQGQCLHLKAVTVLIPLKEGGLQRIGTLVGTAAVLDDPKLVYRLTG